MGINTIGKFFMPKNRIFYDLFEQVAETVEEAGVVYKQMIIEPDDAKRTQLLLQIENLEHKNDDLTHQVFTELSRNFITPFDREDIHHLASALDDIIDYIYTASKKMKFYHINTNENSVHKMAELILQSCIEIKKAVHGLRDMKDLKIMTEALVRVNSIENQADDVYDMSVEMLFMKENDAKEVLKKKEFYQVMEIVTDKCEDAANVIESIIIKYA